MAGRGARRCYIDSAVCRMPGWDAFVSYSSVDGAVAARVQRAIERYRLPDGRRLRVFRDETDISGGELPAQLVRALADCACLIVCCSNAAARSPWVQREIEAFRERAGDRPILPILVADDPPASLPASLATGSLRWADLRAGWRFGLPRPQTHVELVRVIAGVAGIEFRELLPLDRRRRLRFRLRTAAIAMAVLVLSAWIPVLDWLDVTPVRSQVFHCDQLDDGIAWFVLNEAYAIRNIVSIVRGTPGLSEAGAVAGDGVLDGSFIPRGRMLPAMVASGLRERCDRIDAEWLGQPAAGTCIALRESETTDFFADPMGGIEASLTDVIVGASPPFVLPTPWRRLDPEEWAGYGRTMTPSAGLPIAAEGAEIWLGFPQSPFAAGNLWHTVDGGKSWRVVRSISDVHSIRFLDIGLLIAARLDRVTGFYLLRDTSFVPFDVPGKGDDLEVCGQVDAHPLVRTDRTAWLRVRRPWWRARLD